MSQPLFCLGKPDESALYEELEGRILALCPDVAAKHDRTQTAFVRRVQFVWLSMPRRKADAGGLMLSIGLPFRIYSPRVLYAAEVGPARWMHHLVLHSAEDFDAEVAAWVSASWGLIGPGRQGGATP